jgi:hypothetical protein
VFRGVFRGVFKGIFKEVLKKRLFGDDVAIVEDSLVFS